MKRAISKFAPAFGFAVLSCCELGKWSDECRPTPIAKDTECLNTPAGPATPCSTSEAEPNDTLPMARSMAVATCDPVAVEGSLGGATDADYFRAHGTLCKEDVPAVETESTDVEACLFVQCSTGSTSVRTCSDGNYVRHHPSGLLGCCISTPGKVSFPVECGGSRKDVDAFVVATAAPSTSPRCGQYSIRYHL